MLKDKTLLEDLNLVEELDNQASEAINGGKFKGCSVDLLALGEETCQKMEKMCDPGTYNETFLRENQPEEVLCSCKDSRNWSNDSWWYKDENVITVGILCIE